MINRNEQKFPTGESRTFAPDDAGVWRLIAHMRASDDLSTDDLMGVSIDDMPAPFEPVPDNAE
tara:strand:- start:2228 stop:2416 length:189 start_codon:yes stop_codon:yes gene_type:complete